MSIRFLLCKIRGVMSSADLISVTILTKNSAKYLEEVLSSLRKFNEVVLYDTGSNDNTLEIAQKFSNVVIFRESFQGFGPTHNLASQAAKNAWILSIDSDEVVTPEMAEEITSLQLDSNCVYSFPRNNYYNGKFIKYCGWHPDHQVRLYDRTKTRFTDAQVHEAIITKGRQLVCLKSPLQHYSYASTADFLSKMQSYSTLFATQNQGKKNSSLGKAIGHGLFAFFKSYVIKKGVLGGYEGFAISVYNGNTAFYKYLKLYEANQKLKK